MTNITLPPPPGYSGSHLPKEPQGNGIDRGWEPEGPPSASLDAKTLAGAAIVVAIIGGALLAIFCDPPPSPPAHHIFLIDASEGIGHTEQVELRGVIRHTMAGLNEGDEMRVNLITDNPKAPTLHVTTLRAPVQLSSIEDNCGKLSCERVREWERTEQWPPRFKPTGKCAKKRIIQACRAPEQLAEDIDRHVDLAHRGPSNKSPIYEAIEDSEKEFEDHTAWKTPPYEEDEQNRVLHIYSDMVQNNNWYSMIEGEPGYVKFTDWGDDRKLRTLRLEATPQLERRPVAIHTHKADIYRVNRPIYLPSNLHRREMRQFWGNFMNNTEINWKESSQIQTRASQ